jgi:soluble lytic murein transglycosylase-like protein/tetratricopeptide (TPR) repeat protein
LTRFPAFLLSLVLIPASSGQLKAAPDPRIELAALALAAEPDVALKWAATLLETRPQEARPWGLEYWRGRRLLELGRPAEAIPALEAALRDSSALAPSIRWRLALAHEQQKELDKAAEQALILLTQAIGQRTEVVELLERTLVGGGDCRALERVPALAWRDAERRRLALARGHCAARQDREVEAVHLWSQLLIASTADDVALEAALQLFARVKPETLNGLSALQLADAFYQHRDFEKALVFFEVGLAKQAKVAAPAALYDPRYARARSLFWLERFDAAASAFDEAAKATPDAGNRVAALYQKARSLELSGLEGTGARLIEASQAFDAVLAQTRSGRWGGAASISRLRLAQVLGREPEALALAQTLIDTKQRDSATQALMFLASTDLARGRIDRAPAWLDLAALFGRPAKKPLPRQLGLEQDYWRARLAELKGDKNQAVEAYARLFAAAPYDPVGQAAIARLRRAPLDTVATALAQKHTRATKIDDLFFAGRLLGAGRLEGVEARKRLLGMLSADALQAPHLRHEAAPPSEWPLWNAMLTRPEELMLGLGFFDEAGPIVNARFPIAQPRLALAASLMLEKAQAFRQALLIGENLNKRLPKNLPAATVAPALRRALYPLGYAPILLAESRRQAIDPFLLAAVIREESRFDPEAISPVSARGLTQFVLPTAMDVGNRLKLGKLEARDLHRPEIAIKLGAAYLAEIGKRLEGHGPATVAAYNAGPSQARLWRRYCVSDDPVEYLTKVGFKETRDYLTKVLTSRAHYTEIYAP